MEYTGSNVVKLSDMRRGDWIMYQWVTVIEVTDTEPKYIYAGLRPIEDRKAAADNFDAALVERLSNEKAN
jgi:hypothetical protein